MIYNGYVEKTLHPRQLFASGIMHFVCNKLRDMGYDAKKAFAERNTNTIISNIIEELIRSGYTASVRNFKEYIRGFYDVFFTEEDSNG